MKFFYYLIQWTWGLPMNIIGAIVYLITTIGLGYDSYWFRNARCIVSPKNFGGVELGMFFMVGGNDKSVCEHEYGHSIQNLWWGPLFPFVIAIPSAYRYWMRNYKSYQNKEIFALLVGIITGFILVCLFSISLIFMILPLIIISVLAIIYLAILEVWMLKIEIPKYTAYVKYDDIWFEGQATALGAAANQNRWNWL